MSREKKIARYLREANGMEKALTDVLTSQIAMTPRGAHRKALQLHLRQTRDHAKRVQRRLAQLDHGGNPIELGVGLLQNVVGQALGLGRMPFDLLRGRGGEERLLNNAKDNCAAEAREIAMYTAIERLARSLGDAQTAKLAASIRNDEQRMLDVLLSVRVFGTIGKGAIGEKGLVTVTATVLPGALSGVHVASTSTVVPTVLFWTNALMSSLVAVPRGLVAPRTTAQRTPSLAPADTALYAKINRPASTIPNVRTRNSTRTIDSSASDWPDCSLSMARSVIAIYCTRMITCRLMSVVLGMPG